MDGVRARDERAWERVAWQTAHLLNISGKALRRPTTVAKLLGRGRTSGGGSLGLAENKGNKVDMLWERVQADRRRRGVA